MSKGKIYFILALCLLPFLLSATTWYVDGSVTQSGNGLTPGDAFKTIGEAVDALSNGDTVEVAPYTYNETVNFANHYFDLIGDDHLTTIINGGGSSDGIIIRGGNPVITGLSTISEITVKQCHTSVEDHGGGIYIENRNITIENCIIEQNVSDNNGGGIYFTGDDGYVLTITDCTIIGNSTDENGGGIYFYGTGADELIVNSGKIEDNVAVQYGGGVYCEGDGDQVITLTGCIIRDNLSNIDSSIYGGGGVCCIDVEIDFDELTIYNNAADSNGGGIFVEATEFENPEAEFDNLLIYENHAGGQTGGHGGGICILNVGDAEMKINKCSIVYNTGDDQLYGGVYVSSHSVDVVNSIVYGNDGTEGEPQYVQPANTTTTYSCIGLSSVYNGAGNINSDPQFVDAGNDDFHLDWNSPCMDTGDNSYPNDDDGTRCDMGALVARDHDNVQFTLSQTGNENYTWVGFPRLDFGESENEGGFVEATDMLEYFTYPDPEDPPDYIYTWYQTSASYVLDGYWEYNNYDWYPDPCNNLINSTRGFKFKVWDSGYGTNLRVFGDVIPGDTDMTFDINYVNNWICYFLEDVQNGYDAIDATTLSKLKYVTTNTWTAVKTNDVWTWPSPCLLKYGDLVILTNDGQIRPFDFEWQRPARTDVEPYERPVPTQFSYNEEIEYLPVFLDFNGNAPLEVAVYVDNVCRGAEVVDTDSLFQLRAYVLEEEPGYELEFVAYYGRSEMQVMDYQIRKEYNIQHTDKLITGNLGDYAFIEFGEPLSDQIPELEVEMKTYPNPFNPTITISFQVAEFGNIDLDIYNAKGQKVKTLLSKHYCELGDRIEKVWNGYNDQGQPVSGGVYFVRMQTVSDVQMKKMILLK